MKRKVRKTRMVAHKMHFEGMEAKGFARMRFTTIEGPGGGGADGQHRFRIDLTSGKVDGWSLTTGLMFNYGSSNPTDGSNSNGAAQGSMAVVMGKEFNDRFGISQLSINKEITGENTEAEFRAGRISMDSVFSDKVTDIGTGGVGIVATLVLGAAVDMAIDYACNR